MELLSRELKEWIFFSIFNILSARNVFYTYVFWEVFFMCNFAHREFVQSNKIPWTWLLLTEHAKDATVEALKQRREGIPLRKLKPPRGKCKSYLFMGQLRVHGDMKHLRGLESTQEARNASRDISFNLFVQDWCEPLSVCFEILIDNHLSE